MSLRDSAKEIGCSHSGIDVMLCGRVRDAKSNTWVPRKGALAAEEQEEISRGICNGNSMSQIARSLGKAPSTVAREVKANDGGDFYRIWPSRLKAQNNTNRPKASKLANRALCAKVASWLKELWSPEEISNRLRVNFS